MLSMATIIKKIQKMVFVWFADPMQIIVVRLQRFCGNITIISPMSTIQFISLLLQMNPIADIKRK